MRTILSALLLSAVLGIGMIAESQAAGASAPTDTPTITEGWHHGGGHRRGGRGRGWRGCYGGDYRDERGNNDDGWRCRGGNYHYGPDSGDYYCH